MEDQQTPEVPETTDIFLWANNTDGVKNDLDVELFLFNKNYSQKEIIFRTDARSDTDF